MVDVHEHEQCLGQLCLWCARVQVDSWGVTQLVWSCQPCVSWTWRNSAAVWLHIYQCHWCSCRTGPVLAPAGRAGASIVDARLCIYILVDVEVQCPESGQVWGWKPIVPLHPGVQLLQLPVTKFVTATTPWRWHRGSNRVFEQAINLTWAPYDV